MNGGMSWTNGMLVPRHGSRRSITGNTPVHGEHPVVMVDNTAKRHDLGLSIIPPHDWASDISSINEPDQLLLSITVGISGEGRCKENDCHTIGQ
jgi:hypothetical protein